MWHATHSSIDDTLRVPSDCAARKHIDSTWPDFAREPRNLCLGLAMDGVYFAYIALLGLHGPWF